MERWLGALRQWALPKAWRIAEPGAAEWAACRAELERLLEPSTPPPEPPAEPPAVPDADADAFYTRLATNVWRLGVLAQKLDGGAGAPPIRNRVEALVALLKQRGVEFHDYSGQDFDAGEVWDDLVSDILPDDALATIVAMRTPRVRRDGRMLQRGVPILADRAASAPSGDTT